MKTKSYGLRYFGEVLLGPKKGLVLNGETMESPFPLTLRWFQSRAKQDLEALNGTIILFSREGDREEIVESYRSVS